MQPAEQPTEETALTPVQQKVLQQLARRATLGEAAFTARTHRKTIANWRHMIPAFAREFARVKRELAADHEERLASLIPKPIQVFYAQSCTMRSRRPPSNSAPRSPYSR